MYIAENIQRCRQEIHNIKRSVIGLYKLYPAIKGEHYELVVADNGATLDTVTFTQFAAINHSHGIPKRYGEYRVFPDGKNMEDILQDPHQWDEFINGFGNGK